METAVGYDQDVKSAEANREAWKPTPSDLVRELMADRTAYLGFLRGRVRSGADADDILQQALVKASGHACDLKDPTRLRAWFFQILRRTLADDYAQWALREAKLANLPLDMEEATPAEVALCGCSLGQLERIRPEYADMLRRVDIEEQGLSEVAQSLGVSVNNATVRLHRARKALREQLRAFCGTDSALACADCGCDA
jgi:RNA polymerase sigma-70 factor (ECF subfamily)